VNITYYYEPINGEAVTDKFAVYKHKPGAILQVGKRKVVKLI
jgi:hypothetical protein